MLPQLRFSDYRMPGFDFLIKNSRSEILANQTSGKAFVNSNWIGFHWPRHRIGEAKLDLTF
jgi:hypothetical protein